MIDVRALTKVFRVGREKLVAVNNVAFQIHSGEILGLVGESGCGKSTLGRMLVRLEKPTEGQIFFENQEISCSKDRGICRKIQMIFQDPFASLNPRMTVEDLIQEPLLVHRLPVGKIVEELLDLVGLPKNAKFRFPHEFSGGQKQRIGIARALALRPKFLVCDEPISALDVSIQAQIAGLLQRLQKELALTYLFIAHDLAMVRYLSNRIAVMYLGSFVEIASTDALFSNPLHPYTQLLLASIHLPNPELERKRPRILISGDPPSPLHPPPGCPFSNRCPKAMSICKEKAPPLLQIGNHHKVACHLYSENTPIDSLPIYGKQTLGTH
ncbi:MAG TPA: ABC transporter ATP-binding protein [Chlamydiales bacterium]|jgi:oligopeptide/dipeptide ABC transporter ATP-binding protein|nr:ABC transporter ATP-binding protein [Chlamydiales bacterium]